MINATPLAPLALPPNLPPSSCFAPLLPLDAADSRAATALSPAQQEFSSLQAWLSAPRTLQLPLHQVECQQERSEEHTSELQSHSDLVCRLLLEKKKKLGSKPTNWRPASCK